MEDSWAIKMADDIINDMAKAERQWSFENGMAVRGLMKLGGRDKRYFDFCRKYISELINTDSSINGINFTDYSLDIFLGGKTLIDLYKKTKEGKFKRAAEKLYSRLLKHPKNSEGAFCFKADGKPVIWIEGVFSAAPFYAEGIGLFEQRAGYDDVIRQFLLCSKYLRDRASGLFYHCCAEEEYEKRADNKTGVSKCICGRGAGLYGAALADTLDILPERVYDRRYLKEMMKNFSDALADAQDRESGCWYHIMNSPERKGNYPEAEASCLALYFLCAAFRMNIAGGEKIEKAINNSYDGIIDEFVTIREDGKINLNKCCLGAGFGNRDLSFAYYISEPIVANSLRARGAFVAAMNEYDRIKDRLRR